MNSGRHLPWDVQLMLARCAGAVKSLIAHAPETASTLLDDLRVVQKRYDCLSNTPPETPLRLDQEEL